MATPFEVLTEGLTPGTPVSASPDAWATLVDPLQEERRRRLARGLREAQEAYDPSADIFRSGLSAVPRMFEKADLVGGYFKDWQDVQSPWWARALRGTLGIPFGTASKLTSASIGLPPTNDVATLAEKLGHEGYAYFPHNNLLGATYDTIWTTLVDPLFLFSAPEGAAYRAAAGLAKEGVELGAGVSRAARALETMRGFRKGAQVTDE
ncbi:MAG TPA: hypothetical protein VEI97_03670, partial [bacterium]|nr:hypothetical protein [bacterium]